MYQRMQNNKKGNTQKIANDTNNKNAHMTYPRVLSPLFISRMFGGVVIGSDRIVPSLIFRVVTEEFLRNRRISSSSNHKSQLFSLAFIFLGESATWECELCIQISQISIGTRAVRISFWTGAIGVALALFVSLSFFLCSKTLY